MPETLWESVKHLSDSQINKVTHLNAMRFFNFTPFKQMKPADLTVGALRAKAAADKIDTTAHSYGGAAPLEAGQKPRPITSGDVLEMYNRHRKTA